MSKAVAQITTEGGEDELRRADYFPTFVFSTKIHDAESMNAEILAAIRDEQAKDEKGIERSNYRALGGWHSKNHLHKDPRFKRLTDRVNTMASGISKDLGYDENSQLEVTTMWSISNPPLSSNRAHVHPGALWSGVYYVQAPKGSGSIQFTDPRTVVIMNSASFIPDAKRKPECWTKVNVTPVAGKMLFFPSWLFHSVNPNMAEGNGPESERIIISFNINQKKKPKK